LPRIRLTGLARAAILRASTEVPDFVDTSVQVGPDEWEVELSDEMIWQLEAAALNGESYSDIIVRHAAYRETDGKLNS